MTPFLAESLRVVKSDGSVVTVEDGKVTKTEAADQSQIQAVAETPARHSRHSSSSSDAGALAIAVPIVAILCTFAWLIVRTIMSPFANRHDPSGNGGGKRYRRWRGGPGGGLFPDAPTAGLTEEEQAILRKLQTTITQMERRIESLETILIDQNRTSEKYGTKH